MGGAIESTPPKKSPTKQHIQKAPTASLNSLKESEKSAVFPRQRSRGQLARRNSITRGNEGIKDRKRDGKRRHATLKESRHAASPLAFREGAKEERPWLGALFFTDIVFIAFTYLFNLLRTCGLAELADVAAKGIYYAITRLPSDLYHRWTLSTPPAVVLSNRASRQSQRRRKGKTAKVQIGGSSSESEVPEKQHQPLAFTSSHRPEPAQQLSGSPDQLSPFHHLVILLVRFACSNFPHLVPRVLFAEETIGPFVYWRTGGGSNAMVQEFSNLQERQTPVLQLGGKPHRSLAAERHQMQQSEEVKPTFRAYLISQDARLPLEVQRTNLASRSATTLFYLHGGGFSLGSVAFYAEALLRLRAKICALEAADGNEENFAEARCVAVEYDLSPAARFPTPLLQCLRCYAHLIEVEKIDPNSICIAGDSAGGNLAMGLLLCLDGQMKGEEMLSERDWSKLPMPGKALLISPWVDLRPHYAHSFSDLRDEEGNIKRSNKDRVGKEGSKSGEDDKMQMWTEAVAAFDWDYVASEALLHFAQVYTGVLASPRRVRGPVGWFAHVCRVLAREYNDNVETKTGKVMKGKHDAEQAGTLSSLVGPSKKLAQATHDLLSDPFLFKVLGLKDVDYFSEEETSQAISTSINPHTSSFAPLFTSSDRKTETVSSKKHLYEPIIEKEETSSKDEAEKSRKEAEVLLDTHPLISPAVGDWRRIKLKGGCLVTWGERERMADDIESWVRAVHRDIESEKNAPPAQDGESYQTRPATRINFGDDEEEDDGDDEDCWIETAVERGPGGVHAWPFVSMYLAGSELERQRGLDLLADFIARSPMESASSYGEHASATTSLEDRDIPHSSFVDPPHAAPDSPPSETASVGSMPSDVDLHGLVDEDEDRFFQGPGHVIDLVEAARIAHEIRSRDTSEDQHGLGLSNDVDSDKHHSSSSSSSSSKGAAPKITASKGPSKSVQKKTVKPVVKTDHHHHHPQQHQVKHSPTKAKFVGSSQQSRYNPSTAAVAAARNIVERERGRSRSPRRAANLTAHSSVTTSASSSSSSSSATSPSETLPHFISSVRLHRPAAMQAQLVHEAVELPRGRQAPTQLATPLWWTSSTSKNADIRESIVETAKSEAIPIPTTEEGQGSVNDSTGDKGKEKEEIQEMNTPPTQITHDLDEIAEVEVGSDSISPPSQDEDQEVKDSSIAPIDISYYGLSPYSIRRPEPEGLSDIAEEGSVMSASITSATGGLASRSLSPEDRNDTLRTDSPQHQTSLAAASLLLRDQSQPRQVQKPRFPLEEDDDEDIELRRDNYNVKEVEDSSLIDIKEPSISETSSSHSDVTMRKKPKGDVWW